MHVCMASDVDDRVAPEPEREPETMTARELVLSIWDIVQFGKTAVTRLYKVSDGPIRTLDTFRSILMYSQEVPSRRRRTPMNVDKLVQAWIPVIKGLATAHDKPTVDQCEYDEQTHLEPILAAPVAQIREFYAKLTAALKADPTIPFFVWQAFEVWGEVILKKAPDDDVKILKADLAEEIAAMAAEHVTPDLPQAIAGALMWRSTEALEKVKTSLKAGRKPRMVGRSSCLFLEIENEHGQIERVML